MAVLGFSGLHDAVPFKRLRFPHLDPRFQHIVQGHDSAAALVRSCQVTAAAAQERFDGKKVTGAFPVDAMRFCLDAGGIGPEQLTAVAHCFDYGPLEDLFRESEYTAAQFEEVYSRDVKLHHLEAHFPGVDWQSKLVEVPHHLAHAASAFYPSGFTSALVVVVDGMGERAAITVATADASGMKILNQTDAPHSLGLLYGAGTLYLGFWMGLDEYKVMGLAPFGDRARFYDDLMEHVVLHSDGSLAIPLLGQATSLEDQETFASITAHFAARFGPAREPGGAVAQHHLDFAAALQAVLETALLHVIGTAARSTGQDRICLAGGVALNCTANGRLRREGLFRDIFVQPASGDDGAALGAALYLDHSRNGHAPAAMDMPFLGPSYCNRDAREALDGRGLTYRSFDDETELTKAAADLLFEGRIIGWFQGAMEFGPRALGNRSILADPRGAGKRDRINAAVKKREAFRPFAPAVTAAAAADYFDIVPDQTALYRHMLMITDVRPEKRAMLEAVTHVDGSARVQVVFPKGNPRFHALLDAFAVRSGLPVLLNTSFNVMGQPIVRTPRDAVETFLASGLDALVMENCIAMRPEDQP